MKLWIDDERLMPVNYDLYVKDAAMALMVFESRTVTHASFDGFILGGLTGLDLLMELEHSIADLGIPPFEIQIHTSCIDQRSKMLEVATRIYRDIFHFRDRTPVVSTDEFRRINKVDGFGFSTVNRTEHTNSIRVYLDKTMAPGGYIWCKDAHAAMTLLHTGCVDYISLSYHLGDKMATGLEVAKLVGEMNRSDKYKHIRCDIHSSTPMELEQIQSFLE